MYCKVKKANSAHPRKLFSLTLEQSQSKFIWFTWFCCIWLQQNFV